jgi:hypothetical protein
MGHFGSSLSVENIQLMRAALSLRWCCQAVDFLSEAVETFDAAVKTLSVENADFDLDHC